MKIKSQYNEVYNEGRKAFLDGLDFYECTYTGIYFERWVSGYNSAKEEN